MTELTSKDYFADWYRSADPELTTEKISNRIAAIDTIVLDSSIDYWLDILKIYLKINKDIQAKESFAMVFKNDATFPLLNNAHLLKILAGITLCFKLERPASEEADAIAYAIKNCNFFDTHKSLDKIPVVTFAEKYLSSQNPTGRKLADTSPDTRSLTKITTALKLDDKDLDKSHTLEIIKFITAQAERNDALAEELNVLWWIFGERSSTTGKSFKEEGPIAVSLLAAIELSKLTIYKYGFHSAESILNKAIQIASNNKAVKSVHLLDILTCIEPNLKDTYITGINDDYEDFLPFLALVKKTARLSESNDIKALLEKSQNSDTKYHLSEITRQVYNEFTLMKILN